MSPTHLFSKLPGKRWKDEQKPDDPVLEDPRSDDIVIVVMGPTGVGKSTFINSYMNAAVADVNQGMESCTKQMAYYPKELGVDHPFFRGRRLILVDTPGFDDTYESEYQTLRRISVGLAHMRENGVTISGILYLNTISQNRMGGTTRLNYEMFCKICGSDATTKVVMATTHWNATDSETAEHREFEFRTKFWKSILEQGAQLVRIQDYEQDPKSIVAGILQKTKTAVHLQLQEELEVLNKRIPDTEAGQRLRYTLEEMCDMLATLEHKSDPEMQRQLQQKKEAVEERLKELSVPLSDRIRDIFRFKRSGKKREIGSSSLEI